MFQAVAVFLFLFSVAIVNGTTRKFYQDLAPNTHVIQNVALSTCTTYRCEMFAETDYNLLLKINLQYKRKSIKIIGRFKTSNKNDMERVACEDSKCPEANEPWTDVFTIRIPKELEGKSVDYEITGYNEHSVTEFRIKLFLDVKSGSQFYKDKAPETHAFLGVELANCKAAPCEVFVEKPYTISTKVVFPHDITGGRLSGKFEDDNGLSVERTRKACESPRCPRAHQLVTDIAKLTLPVQFAGKMLKYTITGWDQNDEMQFSFVIHMNVKPSMPFYRDLAPETGVLQSVRLSTCTKAPCEVFAETDYNVITRTMFSDEITGGKLSGKFEQNGKFLLERERKACTPPNCPKAHELWTDVSTFRLPESFAGKRINYTVSGWDQNGKLQLQFVAYLSVLSGTPFYRDLVPDTDVLLSIQLANCQRSPCTVFADSTYNIVTKVIMKHDITGGQLFAEYVEDGTKLREVNRSACTPPACPKANQLWTNVTTMRELKKLEGRMVDLTVTSVDQDKNVQMKYIMHLNVISGASFYKDLAPEKQSLVSVELSTCRTAPCEVYADKNYTLVTKLITNHDITGGKLEGKIEITGMPPITKTRDACQDPDCPKANEVWNQICPFEMPKAFEGKELTFTVTAMDQNSEVQLKYIMYLKVLPRE